MDIQQQIKEKIVELFKKHQVELKIEEVQLTPSDNRSHGDYASNIALRKGKSLGMKPFDLASDIANNFSLPGVIKVEAVMPGFLNFFLAVDELGAIIKTIYDEKEQYGNLTYGANKKIDIEYVSANPTGYLHLGHARGAALGDALARIYKKAGFDVTREYYVNDAGNQITNLGKSLMVRYLELFNIEREFPEDGYHGEEIITIAKKLKAEVGDSYVADPDSHLEEFKSFGSKELLEQIKRDLHEFRVDQDVYTSEKAIRARGDIERVLEKLKPYCYMKDGALFLNTTKDGDDKDRVLVKSDGSYTYLLPDIAYHADKFARGFDYCLDLFGADHHGYICRLKSSISDLGYDSSKLTVALVQMVRLFKDGQEFKMSKRTGNAISMKELVEEVGVDSARYFFVSRSANSHLDFDIDLAKKLGAENPVYYAQYTHARLCGILNNGAKFFPLSLKADRLTTDSEKNLLLSLKDYPNQILAACKENEPFKITNYIHSLAVYVNEFYTKNRVLDDKDVELSNQRLGLVKACQLVLKDALNLIGVSAPERMVSSEKENESAL